MKLIFGFPLSNVYNPTSGYFGKVNFIPSEETPIVSLGGIKGLEFRTDEKLTPRGSKKGILSIIDEAREHEILHKKSCDDFDIKQVLKEGKSKVSTSISKISKIYQPFKTSKLRVEDSIGTIIIDNSMKKIYIKNDSRHPQSDREYEIADIADVKYNPFKYFASYLLAIESNIKKSLYFAYGNDMYRKDVKYWLYFVAEGVPANVFISYLKLTKERRNINIFMNENKTICISMMDNLLTVNLDFPLLPGKYQHILDIQKKINDQFRRAYESSPRSRNRVSKPILSLMTELEQIVTDTHYDDILIEIFEMLYWRKNILKDKSKMTKISSVSLDHDIFNITHKVYDSIENYIRFDICELIMMQTAEIIKKNLKSQCPTRIKDREYFEKSSESLWNLLNIDGFNSFASAFVNEIKM